MSQPPNFQLSLELTNILNPLAKTLTALGCSLAGLEGFQHSTSASETLTELHLASSLGRHRVSESIAATFRTIVGQSSRHYTLPALAAQFLVLDGGAARIVRRALTEANPAWLSMVIQVSVLGFAHEALGLARGVADIQLGRGDAQQLEYISVLGAVGFFERVEEKVIGEVMSPARRELRQRRKKGERKRTRTVSGGIAASKAKADAINRLRERSLPFVILKALFTHLAAVQDLPEHRVLHLRTNSGFSTVVVWCYYVLGISVNFDIDGVHVAFGEEPRVFVQDCGASGSSPSASLLDAIEQHKPLFQLEQVEEDPVLEAEDRTAARGFLRRVLSCSGVPQANIDRQAYWIAAFVEFGALTVVSSVSQVRDNCLAAVSLLFDIENIDMGLLAKAADTLGGKANGCKVPLINVVQVIFSFARVQRLEDCSGMPLSLKAFWELSDTHRQPSCDNTLRVKGNRLTGDLPDTITAFNILSHLLLGTHAYTKEYLATAALISSWGWSIYLDSLSALNPGDMHPSALQIRLGVPCRKGERKSRIVDGPTNVPVAYGEVLDESQGLPIIFWPGLCSGRLSATVVGHYGHDAFSVVQVYEWIAGGVGRSRDGLQTTKWRLAFRDKQDMCLGFHFLHGCHCDEDTGSGEEGELVDKMLLTGRFNIEPQPSLSQSCPRSPRIELRYPNTLEAPVANSTPERVFTAEIRTQGSSQTPEQDPIWFFYVTNNVAARWLALDGLDQLNGREAVFAGVVRARTCCIQCACLAVKDKSFVLL
ncbi:uncharacterized protein BDV14DRAFT_210818 [Aspergillus stella-maris]|uniref:uncharacterized protein n=1 Tax=Aspergillus stella-maris TaxID=1810926 RepID=UPI003CCD45FE